MLTRSVFDDGIALLEALFGNLPPKELQVYHGVLIDQNDRSFKEGCQSLAKTFIPRHKGHFPEPGRIIEAIDELRNKSRYDGPSPSSDEPCPYCSSGFVLFRGRWEAEGGWSPQFVRACWCAEGKKRAKYWPEKGGLREATLEELRQNETEYAESTRAYLESLPKVSPAMVVNVREIIHSIAEKVAADDKPSAKLEYTEEIPDDGMEIPF